MDERESSSLGLAPNALRERELPRPKSILSVSAHWFVPETGVTVTTAPRTIYDVGGFPRELYSRGGFRRCFTDYR